MILEKLTIIDTFKQWRDKINAIIEEYEGVPSTDKKTGILTIDTDSTQADSFSVEIPSTFNNTVLFNKDVTFDANAKLNAVSSSTKRLDTPIQFNGTLFDGSEDITTSKWGELRNIIIADHTGNHEGKNTQVNGSENYIFKMPETFNGFLKGDAEYAISLKNKRTIDGIVFDGFSDITHYGICDSDGGEQIKKVDVENFALNVGAMVTVKFMNTNTVGNPQLNVNDTGAIPIYLRDKNIEPLILMAYSTYTFVYDGTNFNVVTGVDSSVFQSSSTLDAEYPILASPIKDGNSDANSTFFAPNIVINPSKNSIISNKFVANINNTTPSSFFVTKNADEDYNTIPVVNSTIRYISYEDNKNHILGCFEFQKNSDGSRYSNIVVPKFNANGNEIAYSVLQVGWNSNNTQQVNCNGDLSVTSDVSIGGDLFVSNNVSVTGEITAKKVYNAVWNDYAEFFEKGEETEVGDIVALDETSKTERYVKATNKSKLVVGVHSDTYGHILGGEDSIENSMKTYIPVGLSGRVYVKFIGKAVLGEPVVPSEIPGVGILYDEFTNKKDQIIGYIVEDLENTLEERKIKILLR